MAAGTRKVLARWDADPAADRAVFRPSTGRWYVEGAAGPVAWGKAGDLPVAGQWDADPQLDRAVFRPSNRRWYVEGTADPTTFGSAGDVIVNAPPAIRRLVAP